MVTVATRQRLLPFLVIAGGSELSALLPPGPQSPVELILSALLLIVVVTCALASTWSSHSKCPAVVPAVLYVVSATLLMFSVGLTSPSGLIIIFLTPVVWTALYQRPVDSALVIASLVVALIVISAAGNTPVLVFLRRVGLTGGLSALVAVTVHSLRERLRNSARQDAERARKLSLLVEASQQMAGHLDTERIIETAVKWIERLVAPAEDGLRRAHYALVDMEAGTACLTMEHSEKIEFPLSDHPPIRNAAISREAKAAMFNIDDFGPSVRSVIEKGTLRYGAWMPVAPDGVLHGVLVCTRDLEIDDEAVRICKTIASVMELALKNAFALDALHTLATTDPLTGTANRRGFELASSLLPARRPFTVLSIDLDGLKEINTLHGHAAGDEMIATVSAALKSGLRRGDTLARLGGDEFAAIICDSDIRSACHVANRMLNTVAKLIVSGVSPRISIGVGQGAPDAAVNDVLKIADSALYGAKRQGGMRYIVSDEGPTWTSETSESEPLFKDFPSQFTAAGSVVR